MTCLVMPSMMRLRRDELVARWRIAEDVGAVVRFEHRVRVGEVLRAVADA
jgi:hypothetical protein